jgi:4-hydroxybenzoate polyprenyltransferase
MQLARFPYLRLMRLHQPTGIWLLLWPCWWSVALASSGLPSLKLLFLFALGATLMRSAGCVVNDIVDRNIDRRVERTRTRPLASGEVSLAGAVVLLVLLLAGAAGVAFAMGWAVVMWSLLSLPLVVIYPFMKRLTWWPQLFLGLTFNWGALVGWVATHGKVEMPAFYLYLGCIFWTLGYDTIYAHQDKQDDAVVGVKSLALHLGEEKNVLGLFYLAAIIFWMLSGWMTGEDIAFFVMLLFAELKLGWQICNVELNDPDSCRYFFISNATFGWLVFAGCVAGRIAAGKLMML